MIRRASVADVADVAAIQRLNAQVLGYDLDVEATRARLQELLAKSEHLILVAEDEAGRVLGYAHAANYDCLYFPPLLNLLALAVDADAQGQGYGKALMEAVREKGRAADYTGIRINSGISRTQAHEFYRKLDYCDEKDDQKRFYWVFERSIDEN